jgi:hypothetical protein
MKENSHDDRLMVALKVSKPLTGAPGVLASLIATEAAGLSAAGCSGGPVDGLGTVGELVNLSGAGGLGGPMSEGVPALNMSQVRGRVDKGHVRYALVSFAAQRPQELSTWHWLCAVYIKHCCSHHLMTIAQQCIAVRVELYPYSRVTVAYACDSCIVAECHVISVANGQLFMSLQCAKPFMLLLYGCTTLYVMRSSGGPRQCAWRGGLAGY